MVSEMKNIMVVDDEIAQRMLIRRILQSPTCNVSIYANADEAFGGMEKTKFDMAYLDVEPQGGMNGIEFGKILRDKFPKMPIIIMSANLDYHPIAIEAGFQDFLYKGTLDVTAVKSLFEKHTNRKSNDSPAWPNAE